MSDLDYSGNIISLSRDFIVKRENLSREENKSSWMYYVLIMLIILIIWFILKKMKEGGSKRSVRKSNKKVSKVLKGPKKKSKSDNVLPKRGNSNVFKRIFIKREKKSASTSLQKISKKYKSIMKKGGQ